MKKTHKFISISVVVILLACIGLLIHLQVKSDFVKDRGPDHGVEINGIEKIDFRSASDPTYRNTCAGCHFPYPPELLPAASWKTILSQTENHFGEKVPMDPKSKEAILTYLSQNGADRSSSKKSIKIMKSLNGQTPLRITEIPYIQKKHRGINSEIFGRKSIGSLSNCTACHRTAKQGNFNEDFVTIPD